MPSLREIQQAFAGAIVAGEDAQFMVAAGNGFDAQHRIEVYRRMVFGNYRKALAATYPVIKRIVGAPFFNTAIDCFVRDYPSRSGDLNVYGAQFGDFLAAYPHAADLPYLPDVARLEWLVDEASRAPDGSHAPDAVLAALSSVPPPALTSVRLELDPSCGLIESDFPILRIWQVNQPQNETDWSVDFDAGGDRLLVRRVDDRAVIARLAAGGYAWLAAIARNAPLGDALEAAQQADRGFDVFVVLREHIVAGTIAGVVA